MANSALLRTTDGAGRYELLRVGTLRLETLGWEAAIATAGEARWRFERPGPWVRDTITATDNAGHVVGKSEGRPRTFGSGSALSWAGRALRLRTALMLSASRSRYLLTEGERSVAVLVGDSRNDLRPVTIEVIDAAAIEPGLLLFLAFLVDCLPSGVDPPTTQPRSPTRPPWAARCPRTVMCTGSSGRCRSSRPRARRRASARRALREG
jgi:hypothetical protein